MSEIINTGDSAYDRYEDLLLKKSALQKECLHLEQEYTRIFGELILTLCRLQIDCARKKKTIGFCQAALNRGEEPDEAALQEFIRRETREMQEHFRTMAEVYENAQDVSSVSEENLMRIRKIYRRAAKLLHPDLHPEVAESEELQDLWNRISVAFECNDLKELEELEVLAAAALADRNGIEWKAEVPDLEEKIRDLEAEIARIMDGEPYQYRFLLEDPEAVEEKKKSLQEEIDLFRDYSARLDEKLAEVLPPGMIIVWDDADE